MAEIVPYAIWTVLIVTGASTLLIGIFAIRSLSYGNVNPLTVVLTAIPIVIVIILGLVMDNWVDAAVMGSLIALVLTSIALLLAGFNALFN